MPCVGSGTGDAASICQTASGHVATQTTVFYRQIPVLTRQSIADPVSIPSRDLALLLADLLQSSLLGSPRFCFRRISSLGFPTLSLLLADLLQSSLLGSPRFCFRRISSLGFPTLALLLADLLQSSLLGSPRFCFRRISSLGFPTLSLSSGGRHRRFRRQWGSRLRYLHP